MARANRRNRKNVPEAVRSILKMKQEELESYVRARVSASPPPPPIDDRAGEENEDILISACRGGDSAFRKRFGSIVKRLCWEACGDDPDAVEFSRVLRMVEELRLSECEPHLISLLAEGRNFLKSAEGYYKRDLLLHVMVALRRVETADTPVVCWQRYLDDSRYAVPAYAGLLGRGLAEAMEHLPVFLRTGARAGRSVSVGDVLLHLFLRYKDDDALYRAFMQCRGQDVGVRRLLLETAKSIRSVSQDADRYSSILFPPASAPEAGALSGASAWQEVKRFREFRLIAAGGAP